MKRETRIGLGVGLLFILGFGLILSEMTNSDSPPPAAGSPGTTNTEYVATSRHVRPTQPAQMRIGQAVTPPPTYNRQARQQATQVAQAPPAEPPQRDRRAEAANVALAATAPARPERQVRNDHAAEHGPPRPQFTEMDAGELQAYVTHAASAPATAPATQRYVVQSGDTLTEIARRFMGDGSWPTVQKLYEMNRNILGDPDQLSVGMELTVPARP